MPARILIFANPIAGRGEGAAMARRIAQQLEQVGFAISLLFDRPQTLHDDALAGARAAVVIGGDGTVRGVAQRLIASPTSRAVPILVVPMGTANLLSRHLGTLWSVDEAPARAAAAITAGKIAAIDAARANGELFLLMAGVGLDAKVVHELDRMRDGPIDLVSYAIPAALALGFYTYPPLSVLVDEKMVWRNRPAVAFVGNVKEYGTGFPMLPHAIPTDGLLDICVLPCASRVEAITQLLRAAAGEHLSGEGTVYLRGKSIRIDSPSPVPIQLDGEAAGHTPLSIELIQEKLRFIVP